jgi:nucleoside-diphosphate-sugar epimerase
MSKKVLILGVNGFIGSALTEAILKEKTWQVYGMDIDDGKLEGSTGHPRFHFVEGDITINKEWIEYHIKKCDVILPLVAIATPAIYVQNPLRVFELDFEANLEIIRKCVHYKKRVIFPSTSEVYGMAPDEIFDEENSNLVLGPIHKQRWIYSCSKQLLDRVIYAYGIRDGLDYTLFRPFNWIGPKLDSIYSSKEGSSRAVTQFIWDILQKGEVKLVDGGQQRRTFTFIDDGIQALLKIIDNKDNCATGKIFNLGNPVNDVSIFDLVNLIIELVKTYPGHQDRHVRVTPVDSTDHFGVHYQDTRHRVPSIKNAKEHLDWSPIVGLREALEKTLDYHINHSVMPLTDREIA